MIRFKALEHEFVRQLPSVLESGKLYISMEFATSAHACCCGCGEEVVAPFAPTDWSMTFDGDTVSLHPSIGNWYLPCRSHYIIRRGKVFEARPWSDEMIDEEWERDRRAKASYYQTMKTGGASVSAVDDVSTPVLKRDPRRKWWQWWGR